MKIQKIGIGIDFVGIAITRPKDIIVGYGEDFDPTDKLFLGIIKILNGANYIIHNPNISWVNTGDEYASSNKKQIIVQLKSTHLMKYGLSKVQEILNFLKENKIPPKERRSRKKDQKVVKLNSYFQFTRLDFYLDLKMKMNVLALIGNGLGIKKSFNGLPKGCDIIQRQSVKSEKIIFKELKIENQGFAFTIYNKKQEIVEKAKPEKFQLYPDIYRQTISDPESQLFRLELRYFRSRSIYFNNFSSDQFKTLPVQELEKFKKKTKLLLKRKNNSKSSRLFQKILGAVNG
jgi:hypothetical protein